MHEGHALFVLHGAFDEALDAYQKWASGIEQPQVELDGRMVPISSVFGRMRTCTDILPWRIEGEVSALFGRASIGNGGAPSTYADADLLLRALCVERLRTAMQ